MNPAAHIIAILFLSREQAHREHLKTKSYAAHVALGDFYTGIVDIADDFAETYQGLYGVLPDIPYLPASVGGIDVVLESHLATIENERQSLSENQDKPLQNIIDNACGLYASTLYKLRRFA